MWNVNSVSVGGGVAEVLDVLVTYARSEGIDARWAVIHGDPEFFAVTKRLHNNLHGVPGDGGPLGQAERAHYEAVLSASAEQLTAAIRPEDIVILHDPQPAGLAPAVLRTGATLVWRCHPGAPIASDHVDRRYIDRVWEFLRRYLDGVDAFVFSNQEYVPGWIGSQRAHIIQPSLDPLSAKNRPMDEDTVRAVLSHVGVIRDDKSRVEPTFTRRDGSTSRVEMRADLITNGPAPPPEAPLITQVTRWDGLKDMRGVMRGFARFVDDSNGATDAHLALVGPEVSDIADDPEGARVLDDCYRAWRELPHAMRSRIQLVCLPVDDVEANAAIVNAIQRHASIVFHKSGGEGWGLSLTEGMWKGRPVVAHAISSAKAQIVHGESGFLLAERSGDEACAEAIRTLLTRKDYAERLGRGARQRVKERFVSDRHLIDWARLLETLEDTGSGRRAS